MSEQILQDITNIGIMIANIILAIITGILVMLTASPFLLLGVKNTIKK